MVSLLIKWNKMCSSGLKFGVSVLTDLHISKTLASLNCKAMQFIFERGKISLHFTIPKAGYVISLFCKPVFRVWAFIFMMKQKRWQWIVDHSQTGKKYPHLQLMRRYKLEYKLKLEIQLNCLINIANNTSIWQLILQEIFKNLSLYKNYVLLVKQ